MKSNNLATAALAISLAALSTTVLAAEFDDYAKVRSVNAEYERVNNPRQECYSEYIEGSGVPAERSYGGSIVGGIAGAILGNQVGGGHGREAATAAGAITGAIVGDRMQNDSRSGYAPGHEVRRCREVDNWERHLVGYRVVYEYQGQKFSTILPNDPGRDLRVRVNVEPY